ncbi:MAG: hypothetical protein ABJC63_06260 [Gemmatimonadales bacterium]
MRIAIIGGLALVLSASTASAQGKTQPVVLSKGVVKSMTANKTKSKTPLGATVGIGRKSSVVVKQSVQAAPTSVTALGPQKRRVKL